MGQRLAAPPLPRAGRLHRREKTNPVTSIYAALGSLKAECPELSWGEFKELTLTTQSYAYARVLDGKAVVAVYNNGDSPVSMEFRAAGGGFGCRRPAGRLCGQSAHPDAGGVG